LSAVHDASPALARALSRESIASVSVSLTPGRATSDSPIEALFSSEIISGFAPPPPEQPMTVAPKITLNIAG
jgi:hypothetical protein